MRRTATVPLDPLGLRWNAYIRVVTYVADVTIYDALRGLT